MTLISKGLRPDLKGFVVIIHEGTWGQEVSTPSPRACRLRVLESKRIRLCFGVCYDVNIRTWLTGYSNSALDSPFDNLLWCCMIITSESVHAYVAPLCAMIHCPDALLLSILTNNAPVTVIIAPCHDTLLLILNNQIRAHKPPMVSFPIGIYWLFVINLISVITEIHCIYIADRCMSLKELNLNLNIQQANTLVNKQTKNAPTNQY